MAVSPDQPVFYYDLGSPYAYLAAERVNALFAGAYGQPPEWQPVLLGGLFKRFGRDSWANGPERDAGMRLYRRLTLIARARTIVKVFYPVFPPDRNAGDVVIWLSGAAQG